MARRRRKWCPFCNELFWPDCRTARRQWSCAKDACQQARRKETQRRYRAAHPAEGAARRLRDAMTAAKAPESAPATTGLSSRIPWDELRDEIRPDVRVLIEFFLRLLASGWRDEMRVQRAEIARQVADLAARLPRDETAGAAAPE